MPELVISHLPECTVLFLPDVESSGLTHEQHRALSELYQLAIDRGHAMKAGGPRKAPGWNLHAPPSKGDALGAVVTSILSRNYDTLSAYRDEQKTSAPAAPNDGRSS